MVKIDVTPAQKELILDALNTHYHASSKELVTNDNLGTIEKKNHKAICEKCKRLIERLNPF